MADEIDLHFVAVGDVARFEARGWSLASTMGQCHHGVWSVLMEREVCPNAEAAREWDAE